MTRLIAWLRRPFYADRAIWIRATVLYVSFLAAVAGLAVSAAQRSPEVKVERNSQQIVDMDKRVANLEALRVDARITTLEAAAQENGWMLKAVLTCLLGLSGDAMYRLMAAKARRDREDG